MGNFFTVLIEKFELPYSVSNSNVCKLWINHFSINVSRLNYRKLLLFHRLLCKIVSRKNSNDKHNNVSKTLIFYFLFKNIQLLAELRSIPVNYLLMCRPFGYS